MFLYCSYCCKIVCNDIEETSYVPDRTTINNAALTIITDNGNVINCPIVIIKNIIITDITVRW